MMLTCHIELLLQSLPPGQASSQQVLPIALLVLGIVAFLAMALVNQVIIRRLRKVTRNSKYINRSMQEALRISGNNVILYDMPNHHSYNLYGNMLLDDGISDADWKRHVHPDDLQQALDWLHKMMAGKLPSAEFDYRWNSNFSGGEPVWRYLHNMSVAEYQDGKPIPVSIISTLSDETLLRQKRTEIMELADKYRQVFEHSIIGLSFYDAEGHLLNSNAEMRKICHFDSEEQDAFFSTNNLFDLAPFSECLDRHHVEELWICSQSVVPERDMNVYLEIRVHPIYDKSGQLIYLSVAARDISEERDMYTQAKLNDAQLRRANEEIQQYESELRYMMESCQMRTWRTNYKRREIEFYKGLSEVERTMTFKEFQSYFLDTDAQVADDFSHAEEYFAKPISLVRQIRPIFETGVGKQWVQINTIPEFDDAGNLIGAFGVMRNVTALMQKQEQLKQETERANDSGRLKSVFLANMTHEIRTPLNAIVGFTDLLQSMEGADEKRELIRIIHNNCDMLLRLINDILALSTFDSNAMQLVPERVNIANDFNEFCLTLARRIEEPGVEFLKENPYTSLVINVDIGRLQQVLTNFVTNAVKYTHSGHIRVGYRLLSKGTAADAGLPAAVAASATDFDRLYVYCEDTGSGIPKEQQSAVFERFVKLNDYIQGTGLGLSICKVIIEKCGGEVGVESEPGKGSLFWYWIPVELQEPPIEA